MAEQQHQDLELFICEQWGYKKWKGFGQIVQRKIVSLKMKHGWEKWSKAVEYTAERDARNFLYLQAILEPETKVQKQEAERFDQIKVLEEISKRREKPNG